MENRIDREAKPEERGILWAATYLLMGLKYEPEVAEQLLKGVMEMKESSTYQYILKEGMEEGMAKGQIEGERREAQKILLRQGSRRFGAPDATIQMTIEKITAVERLEQLIDRVSDFENWKDLLAIELEG